VSETTKHSAKVVWRGDKDDLRAHEIELAGQTLPGSYSAHWGGDPGKADPEELFVASLSACQMLWRYSVRLARRWAAVPPMADTFKRT
jgi:organic hydroperoxide reductase OsmC/OhrA